MRKTLFVFLALLLASPALAADVLFPNLGAAAAVSGTDIIACYQGAEPAKGCTATQVTTFARGISGLTSGQVPLAGSATTLTSSFALGTGVQTALGVNVGSVGAPLVKGTSVCADLSNGATGCSTTVGTAATAATGTSGHTLPFLDGANTFSGTQTFGAMIGTVVARSGTTDTLAAGDCGKTIEYTSATAVTVTLPNSLVIGCHISVIQGAAGQVTVTAAAGGSLVSAHSYTKTFGANAGIGVSVIENSGGSAAKWFLFGDGA